MYLKNQQKKTYKTYKNNVLIYVRYIILHTLLYNITHKINLVKQRNVK